MLPSVILPVKYLRVPARLFLIGESDSTYPWILACFVGEISVIFWNYSSSVWGLFRVGEQAAELEAVGEAIFFEHVVRWSTHAHLGRLHVHAVRALEFCAIFSSFNWGRFWRGGALVHVYMHTYVYVCIYIYVYVRTCMRKCARWAWHIIIQTECASVEGCFGKEWRVLLRVVALMRPHVWVSVGVEA